MARGLYHPARVTADVVRENGITRCIVEVNGFRLGEGASWAACYGDMRTGLAWREQDAANERLRRQYLDEALAHVESAPEVSVDRVPNAARTDDAPMASGLEGLK